MVLTARGIALAERWQLLVPIAGTDASTLQRLGAASKLGASSFLAGNDLLRLISSGKSSRLPQQQSSRKPKPNPAAGDGIARPLLAARVPKLCALQLGATLRHTPLRPFPRCQCARSQRKENPQQGQILANPYPSQAGQAKEEIPGHQHQCFGRGAPGSIPQTSIDPVVMAAAAVLRLQIIISRAVAPTEEAVVTMGSSGLERQRPSSY